MFFVFFLHGSILLPVFHLISLSMEREHSLFCVGPRAGSVQPLSSSARHPLTPGVGIRSKLSAPVDPDLHFIQTPTDLERIGVRSVFPAALIIPLNSGYHSQSISGEVGKTASAPCSKYRLFPILSFALHQMFSDQSLGFLCFLGGAFLIPLIRSPKVMSTEQ